MKNKRIKYKAPTKKALILIMPRYRLKKEMFNLKGKEWRDFRIKCIELMTLLKAWQLKQSEGFDWFNLDEDILDNYLPTWKKDLSTLILVGLIEANPYNNKLNFKNNESTYRELVLKSRSRKLLFKQILVRIDKKRYNNLFKYSNQRYYAKNHLW